jgi:hypothetical protein
VLFPNKIVKEDEMGGACSNVRREWECIQVWWISQKERDHLEDFGISGKKILKSKLGK